jgi:hypothetical protein
VATPGGQDLATYVLRIETVRWAIERLRALEIHSFFIAYLHIRRQAGRQQRTDDIAADWSDLGVFLEVPGGPEGKPYFRPFWTGGRSHGQEWLNQNIAGSYAASSLREVPKRVIDVNGSHFMLPRQHWQRAREHLLYENKAPLWPTAIFLYRDFGFEMDVGRPELLEIFRQDFGYRSPEDDREFEELFDPKPVPHDNRWFEPLGRP